MPHTKTTHNKQKIQKKQRHFLLTFDLFAIYKKKKRRLSGIFSPIKSIKKKKHHAHITLSFISNMYCGAQGGR